MDNVTNLLEGSLNSSLDIPLEQARGKLITVSLVDDGVENGRSTVEIKMAYYGGCLFLIRDGKVDLFQENESGSFCKTVAQIGEIKLTAGVSRTRDALRLAPVHFNWRIVPATRADLVSAEYQMRDLDRAEAELFARILGERDAVVEESQQEFVEQEAVSKFRRNFTRATYAVFVAAGLMAAGASALADCHMKHDKSGALEAKQAMILEHGVGCR